MKYGNFNRNMDGYTVTQILETYHRTSSGKVWKSKPETVKTEVIDSRQYNNYIQSIDFFRNFPNGASCRAEHGYTYAGYIPIRVTTVSPYQETKIVARFLVDMKR